MAVLVLNSPEDPNLVRVMEHGSQYALTLAAGPNLVRVTSMAVKYALNAAVGPEFSTGHTHGMVQPSWF